MDDTRSKNKKMNKITGILLSFFSFLTAANAQNSFNFTGLTHIDTDCTPYMHSGIPLLDVYSPDEALLESYGLHFTFNQQAQTLHLSGDLLRGTIAPITVSVVMKDTRNVLGGGTMTIYIGWYPTIINADLQIGSTDMQGNLKPVEIASHFQNYAASGGIQYGVCDLKFGSNCHPGDHSANYNLFIQNNQLQGEVPSNISNGEYTVFIRAFNNVGYSDFIPFHFIVQR